MALQHRMWYYTGSTCDENGVKTVYDPIAHSENTQRLDSCLNTLSFCWYCIICLKERVTEGYALVNLGFENFYE